jgi:hypothetical protein
MLLSVIGGPGGCLGVVECIIASANVERESR